MDILDIFIFLSSEDGKGEFEAPGRGRGRFFIENPKRGGSPRRRKGVGLGEGPGGCLGELGGGAKYFFFGAEFPPRRGLSNRPSFLGSKHLRSRESRDVRHSQEF